MSMHALAGLLIVAACSEPAPEQQPETTPSATDASRSANNAAPAATIDTQAAASGTGLQLSSNGLWPDLNAPSDPRQPRAPMLRMGAVSVTGRLPPEVVQRIVRGSFNGFRACYSKALEKQATLSGVVSTTFTIETDGSVKEAKTTGGIADKDMLDCVQKRFPTMQFAPPESGVVKVVYPFTFAPPAYAFTIGGKNSAEVEASDVVKALDAAGYEVIGAPSSSQPTKAVSHFKAEKGGTHFSLTLDPTAKLPLEEYQERKTTAVMLEDGAWVLFVESNDPAEARALLDAIHKKLPPK